MLDPSARRRIRVALQASGLPPPARPRSAWSETRPASTIAEPRRRRTSAALDEEGAVTAERPPGSDHHACTSHLGSPKARARYDRTLALEAEESFEGLAVFALRGLSRLDAGTHAVLLDEAAALGIPSARAELLVGRICRRLGVTRESVAGANGMMTGLVVSTPSPLATGQVNGSPKFTLLRCRHCSGVTEMSPVTRKSATARCRHCGGSLKWDCPVCKRNQWIDERRCACGFRQALAEPLTRHFDAAQQAFRTFQLDRALDHLERVRELAPNHADARNGIAESGKGRRAF